MSVRPVGSISASSIALEQASQARGAQKLNEGAREVDSPASEAKEFIGFRWAQ